ncbi:N-acetyl-D-glucosamine kinase [Oopsacas minuta]|uniref:N-acetyl-D-glucosamine kinase n=1 Tax=Oopsacas minuta TaxID=111878 RepID=A0AAV7JRP9_9METZ|nr:N-acetyl-D-glucosamine kinase [Oopsacas minuta]
MAGIEALRFKEVYYCGIDGGGSHSVGVLMNSGGEVVSQIETGSTNYYLVGEQRCFATLHDIIVQLLKCAGVEESAVICSIGMTLSGAEKTDVQERIKQAMKSRAEFIFVGSDTMGAIHTASMNGGMVLIAGSGSNCQLLSPDGITHNCGGWGNMLGDEGSAYQISWSGIKIVIDHRDGYHSSQHDVTRVETELYKYFDMKEQKDILQHFYTEFCKGSIAGFCREIAGLATAGDALSLSLFDTAGRDLGQHVVALLGYVTESVLKEKDTGLLVVAAGGVWKSWDLLKSSFLKRVKEGRLEKGMEPFQLTIVQLITTSAVGACYLGAKQAGEFLAGDLKKNINVFYSGMV